MKNFISPTTSEIGELTRMHAELAKLLEYVEIDTIKVFPPMILGRDGKYAEPRYEDVVYLNGRIVSDPDLVEIFKKLKEYE